MKRALSILRFAQTAFPAIAASLLASATAFPDETVVEVITLKYRRVPDVIPVIQPLVDRQGAVTGLQNQLIVRTTPANLSDIRKVIDQIDRLPRRLMVTVRQDADRSAARREAEISGRIGGNPKVSIPGGGDDRGLVIGRAGGDGARARLQESEAADGDRNTQSLQVLEGNTASIQIGQSVPIAERTVVQTPYGARVADSLTYRDVTSGFLVRPLLNGDRVTLEISPHRDAFGVGPGSIEVQSADTQVSGRLGEWIDIGGLVQDRSRQSAEIGARASASSADLRTILIKVEEMP